MRTSFLAETNLRKTSYLLGKLFLLSACLPHVFFPQKFPHFSCDERKMYAAMVASLDESIGNITKALKRNGLYDNSVIVFTTDNGGAPRGFNW